MLIEIAGIDGSGKTTLLNQLRGHLHDQGRAVYVRSWPSTVKRLAADTAEDFGGRPWWEFFDPDAIETAAAFEHLAAVHHHLLPLDPGRQVVLTDTYVVRWLATAALHGAALEPLVALYARLRAPELSLRLEVDTATARERLAHRPERDHPTTTGAPRRLDRYRAAFDRSAGHVPYRVHRLDAGQPPERVLAHAARLVRERLG
ncbi:AAA family ATPase [Nocardiopsis sp. NPDC006198]|uniref:AAA family ATPase n=1 Tax=Nocardiopsis sp. NPDC006198 TaxID=3154472 RepID=UPI0033AF4281